MENSNPKELPYWHFFHCIESELSYERWIEKYKCFLSAITGEGRSIWGEDILEGNSEAEFRQFCKFLYLQDVKDEKRFDELLTEAIQIENKRWEALYKSAEAANETTKEAEKPKENAPFEAQKKDEKRENKPADTPVTTEKQEKSDELPKVEKDDTVYFKYGETVGFDLGKMEIPDSPSPRFLETDEYFPITRREMVKSWQYLRMKKKEGFRDLIDVHQTVLRIAKEGLFTEAAYKSGYKNRKDTLIIFVDRRGSMTPFEILSDRLIETAKSEGGHANAPVYYFQNNPNGYVFEERNLSKPQKLTHAMKDCTPSVTYAIIISDAGAARGNTDSEMVKARTTLTRKFLSVLQANTARIIWLNPMPKHRWEGTAASCIMDETYRTDDSGLAVSKPDLMLSVLDEKSFHFHTALQLLRVDGKNK